MEDLGAENLVKDTNQQSAHTKAVLEDMEISQRIFREDMKKFREGLAKLHEELRNIKT